MPKKAIQKKVQQRSLVKYLSKQTIGKFFKNNYLIIAGLAFFSIVGILYIQRTFVDVPYIDGLMTVFTADKYFKGTLTFNDIFNSWAGQHHLAGYTIIFLLNTIFFHLNMKIEPLIFLFSYFCIGVLFVNLFSNFIKESIKKYSNIIFQISAVSMLFIVFSFVHPPGQLMATQFVVGTLFFVILAFFFDRMCQGKKDRYSLPAFFASAFIYIIFFSGAFYGGILLSLLTTLILKKFFSDHKKINSSSLISLTLILLLIFTTLYLTKFDQDGTSLITKLVEYFTHPAESLKSILAGLSASNLDIHTYQERFSSNQLVVLANGLFLLAIGVFATIKFVTLKLYRFSYLPIMLMAYPLGIIVTTRLGRVTINSNWDWIMNEWYAYQLYFYILGVLWIIYYILLKKLAEKPLVETIREKSTALLVLSLIIIFSLNFYASNYQWQRGTAVYNWLGAKRQAVINPKGKNLVEQLYISNEDSLKAIEVLKKYHLSLFRQ